jgi:hypothetical protein
MARNNGYRMALFMKMPGQNLANLAAAPREDYAERRHLAILSSIRGQKAGLLYG